MQTKFGQWFDPYIDKLTDFLLIFCLVIVVYSDNNNIETVIMGMIMMGLVFITQFLMLYNDLLFRRYEEDANDPSNGKSRNPSVSSIMKIYNIIPGLGHSQFYFVTSVTILFHGLNLIFQFTNYYILYVIFYIVIFLGLITFVKISLYNIYKLGYRKDLD